MNMNVPAPVQPNPVRPVDHRRPTRPPASNPDNKRNPRRKPDEEDAEKHIDTYA